MSTIQRYGSVCGGIGPVEHGNYVLYSDYLKETAALYYRVAELEQELAEAKKTIKETKDSLFAFQRGMLSPR